MEPIGKKAPGIKRDRDYKPRIKDNISKCILYLFSSCYKWGIDDAENLDDIVACEDYVSSMKNSNTFMLISDNVSISWKEWRLHLCVRALRITYGKDIARRFLLSITSYGAYYSVPLRIAMDYYVKGVEDFAKYPERRNLHLFLDGHTWDIWRNGWERGKKRNILHFLDDVQLLTFNRIRWDKRIDEQNLEGSGMTLTERTYMNFIEAMWRNYSGNYFFDSIEP